MSQTFASQSAAQSAAETLGGAQSDLLGLAVLGKTALALAIVIGVILLCSAVLKRLGPGRGRQGQHLKVVASTAVGQRERVVIVEVQDTWLVLGVGGGQVNSLHTMSTPPDIDSSPLSAVDSGGFASRFAAALRHNARAPFSNGRSHGKPSGDKDGRSGGKA
nr:flagellar biosynthetic protein FliO [uncultured Halomonas sp.]